MKGTAALITRLQIAVVLGSMAVVAFGCDDGIGASRTPTVELIPERFGFPKVAQGENLDRTVEIRNVGTGDLLIGKIRFEVPEEEEFQLFYHFQVNTTPYLGFSSLGEDKFTYPIRVEPESSLFFTLNYKPKNEGLDVGQIILETNLPDEEVVIPIGVSQTGPEISVLPTSVNFERVTAGTAAERIVTVQNIGEATLSIQQILINGNQEFVPLVRDRDPRRLAAVLDDPDNDGTAGLSPGKSFQITLRYSPRVEGRDSGTLAIFSDDPNRPEVNVEIEANGNTACISVSPNALEFRTSLVNRSDSRPLSIESCGGEVLHVTGFRLSADTDPAFELDQDSLPDLPLELAAFTGEGAPPSRLVRVAFTPREQRIYNGTLIIESDDPVTPEREVSLLGRGVLNECPRASAVRDEFNVLPLDVVDLDGAPSIDPDGPNNRPVQYEWVITSRPQGSVSQPVESFFDNAQPANGGAPDDSTTPRALFFVDLAGTYTAELRVRDNLGLGADACGSATALVTIVAKPEEAIHIQLVWHTPGDANETDLQGTDLDLHLLHPRAESWFSRPYDCHFENPVPDWGQLEDSSDDPELSIDDINGAGPENINLDRPESTDLLEAPYLVGVHYYKSKDRQTQFEYGPSYAKVRVFLNGELAWDYTEDGDPGEREMQGEDHFWDVAQITWPTPPALPQVIKRDRYFTSRP